MTPNPTSREERKSRIVFLVMLGVALLATRWPDMAGQGFFGLWAGALGLLMVLFPPRVRSPRLWRVFGSLFLVAGLAPFLPMSWAGETQGWRAEFEAISGMDTGGLSVAQPWLALESWFAAALLVAGTVFLAGHRAGQEDQWRLALVFAGALALLTVWAMSVRESSPIFGFFPNRNHTATMLATGFLASLGLLAQGARARHLWQIAVGLAALGIFATALIGWNESRAGLFLVVAGLVIWLVAVGPSYLKGAVGKVILLAVIAAGGAFLMLDSTLKSRWAQTIDKVQSKAIQDGGVGSRAEARPESLAAASDAPLDLRLPVFEDTLSMIVNEPWTGVGAGQFRYVFPQYRVTSAIANQPDAVHPESDWLMVAAETGAASAVFLGLAVIAAAWYAFRALCRGRQRALRAGLLAAAVLLPLHGVFDVPGHRAAPVMIAVWLAVLSLPPKEPDPDSSQWLGRPVSGANTRRWRLAGFLVLAIGTVMLVFHVNSSPLMPSAHVAARFAEINRLYHAETRRMEAARDAGHDPLPAPGEPDLLEDALAETNSALWIAPLDPALHFARAALSLHYDDKQDQVAAGFNSRAHLIPFRVFLPLEHAAAWAELDPDAATASLEEAMRRARDFERRFPDSRHGLKDLSERAAHAARKNPSLLASAVRAGLIEAPPID